MDLVTGALGILAPKLLELLKHEYKLQAGLRDEVRSLAQELEHVDAFLREVADVPWDRLDEQVKVWSCEVREASYDMEDALDCFLLRVEDRKPGDDQTKLIKRTLKKVGDLFSNGKPRREIAAIIENIKKQLKDVADRRARYRIDDSLAKPVAPTSSAIDPLAAMYHEVDQIIGIDESRAEVISMLDYQQPGNENDHVKKVSVVGVGGLGKTTLAKAVYEKLKGGYDCGAFVSVGRDPDLKRVFKDILLQLDEKKYENLNMPVFQIRGFLKDKRYFIVIDDIWDPKSWEIIKLALVENNSRSSIIITTRNLEVAKEAGKVYKLPPLSDDHSKRLFYTRIFGGAVKCLGVQSNETSDKILRKCGGIPLAIITMASLLVGKPREVWSELYSNIWFEKREYGMPQDTKTMLSFSYYDLPSHLRTCLLYLSAFPEDYVIAKDPLIWKLVAEGFVNKKDGYGLFELGEQYVNDLINRSMIQAVESEYDGTIEGYCVHGMVLDLIRSLSCQINFATTYSSAERIISQSKVRRLAYQKCDLGDITPQADHMDISAVRSCIASRCHISRWDPLWSFKLVRVLTIEDCRLKEDCQLQDLGNLLHLRYLSLRSCTGVKELPEQVGKLKFLQILDFDGTDIDQLPASIVWLTQLVCLSCRSDGFTCGVGPLPNGIGKLTSLEQLTINYSFPRFWSGDEELKSNLRMFVKELGSLGELRVLELDLCFVDEIVQRYLIESLRNLRKIQRIKLKSATFSDRHAYTAMWEETGSLLPQHICCLWKYSGSLSCHHGSHVFTTSHSWNCVWLLWMSMI